MTTGTEPGTRTFRMHPRRSRRMEVVLVLLSLSMLVTLLSFVLVFEPEGKPLLGSFSLFALIGAIPLLALGFWQDRRLAATAKLTLDAQGMRLQSDLRASLLQPWAAWDCPWDDVAQVIPMESLGMLHIQRKGAFGKRVALRLTDWVEDLPGAGQQAPPRKMRETPLWQALEQAGLLQRSGNDARLEAIQFDMAKHPATLAVLLLAAALFLYGFVDGALASEAWAEWRQYYLLPHFVFAALISTGTALLLVRARNPRKVPGGIVAALSILMYISAGIASWNGLIRVNQLAGGPLMPEAYTRNVACDTLLPVKKGLPEIEYTGLARNYWCQFPLDQRHTVPVRQGLFGLYQVDLGAHTRAIDEYRQAHPTKPRPPAQPTRHPPA